jgi:hypothetical protein
LVCSLCSSSSSTLPWPPWNPPTRRSVEAPARSPSVVLALAMDAAVFISAARRRPDRVPASAPSLLAGDSHLSELAPAEVPPCTRELFCLARRRSPTPYRAQLFVVIARSCDKLTPCRVPHVLCPRRRIVRHPARCSPRFKSVLLAPTCARQFPWSSSPFLAHISADPALSRVCVIDLVIVPCVVKKS